MGLCRCPGRTVVTLGWGSSDEAKMQASFGTGRLTAFSSFVDLGQLFQDLGYEGELDDCGKALLRAAASVHGECHDVQLGVARLCSVSGCLCC